MGNLKLFSKIKEQIHTLFRTGHVFSTDIRMKNVEFVCEKCEM